MKFKILFFVVCVTITTISCKNEENNQKQQSQEIQDVSDAFIVTLDVIAKKNDDFCLLYTEDGSINFKEGVWQSIKGSNNSQKLVFSLPDDAKPTQLRIDFGMNKEQEEIILNSFTMEYIGKSRTIGCPELVAFFRADDSKCTFDHVTGIIKPEIKNGVRQNPSLYPHESNMMPAIQKILN